MRMMTVREVADQLHVSEKTVRRLLARRSIRCIRVGRQVRFSADDVMRWIEGRKEGG